MPIEGKEEFEESLKAIDKCYKRIELETISSLTKAIFKNQADKYHDTLRTLSNYMHKFVSSNEETKTYYRLEQEKIGDYMIENKIEEIEFIRKISEEINNLNNNI